MAVPQHVRQYIGFPSAADLALAVRVGTGFRSAVAGRRLCAAAGRERLGSRFGGPFVVDESV